MNSISAKIQIIFKLIIADILRIINYYIIVFITSSTAVLQC